MRAPSICRQCLYRLVRSLSQPSRLHRATLHTQAIQELEGPSPWQWSEDSPHRSGELEARDQAPESNGIPEQSQCDPAGVETTIATRKVPISRVPFGSKQHIGRSRGITPVARWKSRVLSTQGNYVYLIPDLMAVYGLNYAGGYQAANQLKRLIWNRSRQDVGKLFDDFDTWKAEYGLLLWKFDTVDGKDRGRLEISKSSAWFDFSANEIPSVASMASAWQQLDAEVRRHLWSQTIIAALGSNLMVFSNFVRATFDCSTSSAYVVEDTIRLLLLRAKSLAASERNGVLSLVNFLLRSSPAKHLNIEQDVFAGLVSLATVDEAKELYDSLRAKDHRLDNNTLLQFASRFAKSNQQKVLGAEILCSMTNNKGFSFDFPEAASICTSLLSLGDDGPFPEDRAAPDKLFKMLLSHGFRPNLINLTALMSNFCDRGHLRTAWTIFDLLIEYGIKPDQYVYLTLLKGAKKELDVPSTQGLMSAVLAEGTWNTYILNEFLDIMNKSNKAMFYPNADGIFAVGRRQRKANSAFRPMLQVYAKHFHLEPLQRFFTTPLEDKLVLPYLGSLSGQKYASPVTDLAATMRPQPGHLLIDPDTVTLTLMISAYVRSLNHPRRVLRTYNHFVKMLLSKDRLVLRIIERHGSLIYDIFLRGLLEHGATVDSAVQIVRDMLDLSKREEEKLGKNIQHPRPSVHTWTIMVNGFKNHRMPRGAVSIIKMMTGVGELQPTLATWNALIAAFAKTGNARAAVKAMRYLERDGLHPDEKTTRAFRYLRKKARDHAVALLQASEREPTETVMDDFQLSSGVAPRIDLHANALTSDEHAEKPVNLSYEDQINEERQLLKWEKYSIIRPRRGSDSSDGGEEDSDPHLDENTSEDI